MKDKDKQQKALGCVIIFAALVVIAIVIMIVAEDPVPQVEDDAARAELFASCAYDVAHDNIGTILGNKRDSDICQAWAEITMNKHKSDVRNCHQTYVNQFYLYVDDEGTRIDNFESCIKNYEIEYP